MEAFDSVSFIHLPILQLLTIVSYCDAKFSDLYPFETEFGVFQVLYWQINTQYDSYMKYKQREIYILKERFLLCLWRKVALWGLEWNIIDIWITQLSQYYKN